MAIDPTRRAFINVGHFFDHLIMLLFPTVVIGLEAEFGGSYGTLLALSTAGFIAYLSSLTNVAYTATQYALFSSFMTLPGKFLAGFSGLFVDASGYVSFFLYTTALGLPAVLLVLYLMRRSNPAGPAES